MTSESKQSKLGLKIQTFRGRGMGGRIKEKWNGSHNIHAMNKHDTQFRVCFRKHVLLLTRNKDRSQFQKQPTASSEPRKCQLWGEHQEASGRRQKACMCEPGTPGTPCDLCSPRWHGDQHTGGTHGPHVALAARVPHHAVRLQAFSGAHWNTLISFQIRREKHT